MNIAARQLQTAEIGVFKTAGPDSWQTARQLADSWPDSWQTARQLADSWPDSWQTARQLADSLA